MASILRQIVAGPRAWHPEGLDLCYVTDFIIATSGPSQTFPQMAYRTPLDQLVNFLDAKHGEDWAIWEFRAEGTGYPDEAVYNRIWHYPWPDHHPPPFRLIPLIMASMRNWLHGDEVPDKQAEQDGQPQPQPQLSNPPSGVKTEAALDTSSEPAKRERNKRRVVVVHCKAGKGRSGTASCSYLISEEGWTADEALARFTQRRMRPQFGAGVSIPSQLRWIKYVDRWTKGGKKYTDRPVEILSIHVWGLRNGVKMDIEAFADEGKRIETIHTFTKEERIVEGDAPEGGGLSEIIWDLAGYTTQKDKVPEAVAYADATNNDAKKKDSDDEHKKADSSDVPKKSFDPPPSPSPQPSESSIDQLLRRGSKLIEKISPPGSHSKVDKFRSLLTADPTTPSAASSPPEVRTESPDETEPGGLEVTFKPKTPIRISNSDVNIAVERRNRTNKSMGLTMVTAVAYVWFNVFFEGNGPEQGGRANSKGVFEIEWDAMDGVKGSSRKGTRAFDRMRVEWQFADSEAKPEEEVLEPKAGEPVPQAKAADWTGTDNPKPPGADKDLGLRQQSPISADISRASSVKSVDGTVNQTHPLILNQGQGTGVDEDMKGLKRSGPSGEDLDEGEKKI